MAGQKKDAPNMTVSDGSGGLPDDVAPRTKTNVRFAFACAILASMTSILLGYGTDITTICC